MKVRNFLIVFFFSSLFLFFFFLLPRLIVVKNISCDSQYGPCTSEYSDNFRDLTGKNYLSVKKGINNLLKNDYSVSKYSLSFKLPNRVDVYVVIRKSLYALRDVETQSVYLVSEDGTLGQKVASTNLPIISIHELPYSKGAKISDEIIHSLEIYRLISSVYEISNASIEKDAFKLKISSGPEILFGFDGECDILAGSARLIVEQIKTNSDELRISKSANDIVVDLRFKNPVLR